MKEEKNTVQAGIFNQLFPASCLVRSRKYMVWPSSVLLSAEDVKKIVNVIDSTKLVTVVKCHCDGQVDMGEHRFTDLRLPREHPLFRKFSKSNCPLLESLERPLVVIQLDSPRKEQLWMQNRPVSFLKRKLDNHAGTLRLVKVSIIT